MVWVSPSWKPPVTAATRLVQGTGRGTHADCPGLGRLRKVSLFTSVVCVCMCVWVCMCRCAHVEGRKQLAGIGPLLLLCEVWDQTQ